MPSRTNLYRVTAYLDGVFLGQWDDKTGGDTDSNSVQYFQGGGGPRVSLGGTPQVANVILMVLLNDQIRSQRKWIRSRVGKGTLDVFQQELDDELNPIDEPDHWNCKLKRFKEPDAQSQTAAAAICEMEGEVNGVVA